MNCFAQRLMDPQATVVLIYAYDICIMDTAWLANYLAK